MSQFSVLHVGKFYPPYRGGMESHLAAICEGLQAHAVAVDVVVANDGRATVRETCAGVPVTRLGSAAKVAGTSFCPGLTSTIKHTRADIVHLHLPNPAAVLAYLRSGRRGPLVVTYHSDTVRQRVLGPIFAPVLRHFLSQCQAIIVTSPNYVESSGSLRPHRDRCHVIPLGIPDRHFLPPDPAQVTEARRRYGDPLVLGVGRLVYYKGFEYLIRAMQHTPGRLLIVGDGPLRPSLLALAQQLGVASRITLLGACDDSTLHALMHTAQVFVLSSVARSEAFGLVQAEALAAGCPVVNTQLASGVPFVSLDGVTGITVPPQDPESLGRAIRTLLEDDSLRNQYALAARQRAATEFRQETMVERTILLYQQVLGHTSSPLVLAQGQSA